MEGASVLLDPLRQGDRAALGRAITLIESERTVDARPARELVEQCLPLSGKSLRLGVTGIPGAGKSTLIDALGTWFIAAGHRVAVLAVDPSSIRSGGSILGDKTRMEKLAVNDAAFIRPSAAAGNLGGVARRTREAIIICEAAGYDRILVETVGAGQNELEVERMTDLNLLLMIAGAGDELQGIKRGIMESADLIAFTKADGAARERAEAARRELGNAITLLPVRPSGRAAELMLTSAVSGEGIPELGLRIEGMHAQDRATGFLQQHRREQGLHWMRQAIDMGLRASFERDEDVAGAMRRMEEEVREGMKSPFAAADELLALFRKGAAPLP